ncbi:ABC transporter permease YtrF precursor [Stieleria bergensis]|uniref:ABC transporter permease YtrF n=1 Tax=Stieleria bergensis TaxID=2528025 RepID=A0A517SNM5_9BACT|nr:MAG: peptide ABC transporter permease [Rhodopirellula sp. TMED11]QDT57719.1 ABC transporter permease YtrF precursor [Planctomycetes bacterium SV_7m_r]
MWLIRIAWRNFQYRALSSLLTTLSLTLGVALVVLVLAVVGIVSEAFSRNAQVGYNLVVGPKGSALQLTLNSVYYLSQPIENLPFTEYMEFFDKDTRAKMVRTYGGDPALGERAGKYSAHTNGGFAIPLALGDYLGEYRVVGTTPQFFEDLRYGPELTEPFSFREGRALKSYTEENSFFEAVLGFRVAKTMNLKVGDTFNSTHGDPEGMGHGQGFVVVGVMEPTGTPNDRVALVNLEGFYLLEKHAKPLNGDEVIAPATEGIVDAKGFKQITIPEREVTSILIRSGNPMLGVVLQNTINESLRAQAAAPAGEITKLMDAFIGPVLTALLVITLITCVVAAVGVLVAIYNSMNDRRRDIAVMRALGARRDSVTAIILAESLLIAVIGAVAGWLLAHGTIWLASGVIEQQVGIQVGIFSVSEYETWVFPLVIMLALFAGFLPAMSAYRTNVATNLSA